MKKIFIVFLVITLILGTPIYASEENKDFQILIDTADEAVAAASGGASNADYTKRNSASIKWDGHDKQKYLSFKSTVTDWSDYTYMDFMMYSEKATNTKFLIQPVSSPGYKGYYITVNWTGWKHFKIPLEDFFDSNNPSFKIIAKINFYAHGWDMQPSADTVLYLDNVYLSKKYECLDINAHKTVVYDADMDKSSHTVTDITKTASKSLKWHNQDVRTHLDFDNVISADWSEYTHLVMWIYSEKAVGSKLLAGIQCNDGIGYYRYSFSVDWVGWKQIKIPFNSMLKSSSNVTFSNIQKFWIYADGWGMTPNPETVVYIDSVYLECIKRHDVNYYDAASMDIIKEAQETVKDISIWHYGNKSVLVNGNRVSCGKENKYIKENGVMYVPSDFFEVMMNVSSSTSEYVQFDGENYIPLEETAEKLGITAVIDRKFIFTSSQDMSGKLETETMEFIKKLYAQENVDISELTDSDYEEVLLKWENYLTGNEMEACDAVTEKKNSDEWYALYYQRTKGTPVVGDTITGYWNIVIDSTADMGDQFNRLRQMAVGYATEGTDSYKSESLKNDILSMLDWLYENLYGIDEMNNCGWRDTTLFNWWEWQIGVPQHLSQTLLLMRNDLSTDEMNKYLEIIDFFAKYEGATGANLVDTVYPRLLSAVLRKDAAEFFEIKSYLEKDMAYQPYTNGEGTQPDGSYRYHYYYAMNGTYGVSYVYAIASVINILDDTKFAITGCEKDDYIEWIFKGFEPIIYNGKLMTMFRGRHPGDEKGTAISIINGLLQLVDIMDNEEYEKICSMIKQNCTEGNIVPNSGFKYAAIEKYNEIMNSDDISPRENYSVFNVYYNTDKAVWHNDDFAFAVSMNSSRTSGWESINGENKKGWYQGDGMVYMYYSSDNLYNYESTYWSNVDPYMLPGITADEQERVERSIHDQRVYKSSKDFVGGAAVEEKYGIAAMELESCHNDYDDGFTSSYGNSLPVHENDLVAKKSWFIFDNELVALGSGINSTMNSNVKTVIENRITDSSVIYSENGQLTLSEEITSLNTGYINANNQTGYVFDANADIKLQKEVNNVRFTKIWTDHGKNPVNGKYSYITLPNQTAEETKAYYQNPDVEILANTEAVQAVKEKNTGLTGYVFWQAGELNNVSTDKPIILMLKENGRNIKVSVSDPTQKLSSVTVNLGTENLRLLSGSEKAVTDENGNITFNVSGLNGATVEAELYKIPDLEVTENNGTVTVINNSVNQQCFTIINAEYEGETLKYVYAEEKSLNAGEEMSIDCSTALNKRLFIWMDTENIQPVQKLKGED